MHMHDEDCSLVVDALDADQIAGWYVNRQREHDNRLHLRVNGHVVVTVQANLLRTDVEAAGVGHPLCGFSIKLPVRLRTGDVLELLSAESASKPRLKVVFRQKPNSGYKANQAQTADGVDAADHEVAADRTRVTGLEVNGSIGHAARAIDFAGRLYEADKPKLAATVLLPVIGRADLPEDLVCTLWDILARNGRASVAEQVVRKALNHIPGSIRYRRQLLYSLLDRAKLATHKAEAAALAEEFRQVLDLFRFHGGIDRDLLREGYRVFASHGQHGIAWELASEWTRLVRSDPPELLRFVSEQYEAQVRGNLHSDDGGALKGLSPAANARLMVGLANAHRATGRVFDAALCYLAATCFDANNGAASFNLAFALNDLGLQRQMDDWFSRIRRVYLPEAAQVVWPAPAGKSAWPRSRLSFREHFQTMLPPGKSWPRISIVTPSLNQGVFIEETILSVLNQDYPNLQYIVVDGLSTDETAGVIGKYHDRIDCCIIEADSGQSNAINKGFGRADGELLGWLNSDDMLAPGALFAVALTYLKSDADVIAGSCVVHRNGGIQLITRPAVSQVDLTVERLADIFNVWLSGDYFYQPEVLFTRRVWENAGGRLDEDLKYVMDYDLWMRFAQCAARLQVISWPVAMFRHHEDQKTANMDATIEDQLRLRDKYFQPQPPFNRVEEIRAKLARMRERKSLRILVCSSRAPHIFSEDTADELTGHFATRGHYVEFTDRRSDINLVTFDLLIYLVHLQHDIEAIHSMRVRGFQGPVIAWYWDNHHDFMVNAAVANVTDVNIPGHASFRGVLRNETAVLVKPLPLCVTQWTKAEAQALFVESDSPIARCDALYGGFVKYPTAQARTNLVSAIMNKLSHHNLSLIDEDAREFNYFGLSPRARFKEWMSHKVSLVLPLHNDVSQRLFDALLTGQIPLVPSDLIDLDEIVSPGLRESLPIMTFTAGNADSAIDAYRRGLAAYDKAGVDGRERRHRFALGHTFVSRMDDLVSDVLKPSWPDWPGEPTTAGGSSLGSTRAGEMPAFRRLHADTSELTREAERPVDSERVAVAGIDRAVWEAH